MTLKTGGFSLDYEDNLQNTDMESSENNYTTNQYRIVRGQELISEGSCDIEDA